MPADGNCFFRAASLHLDHDETSLRAALCNHMEDNLQNYIGFFSTEGSLTEEEKVQAAKTQIEMIRQPGQWNSQANDILP
ncbi:OTU domain-containing protein, partial [Thiolapillus sp.]|uniref:OTU domain-containing protein n=1 Tax=Thiolapillus sp. TaxID=2017437 RepID=UPI003AF564FB